jgi:hypothetical protein
MSDEESEESLAVSDISQDHVREEIPNSVKRVKVKKGSSFSKKRLAKVFKHSRGAESNLSQTDLSNHRHFRIYTYMNQKTKRNLKLIKCDWKKGSTCKNVTRKFGNFYDHYRTHTNERPFKCKYAQVLECNWTLTQKSNLNKHEEKHEKQWGKECLTRRLAEYNAAAIDTQHVSRENSNVTSVDSQVSLYPFRKI